MDAINTRKSQDLNMQASLHGMSFKGGDAPKTQTKPLSNEAQKALDRAIQKRLSKGIK